MIVLVYGGQIQTAWRSVVEVIELMLINSEACLTTLSLMTTLFLETVSIKQSAGVAGAVKRTEYPELF